MEFKIDTVVIDTITRISANEYAAAIADKKNARAEWEDWGKSAYNFYRAFEEYKIAQHVILILGREGSGKTYGIKNLTPGTCYYFNVDRKKITCTLSKEQKALFGNHLEERPKKLMSTVTKYDQILKRLIAYKEGHKDPDGDIIKLAANPIIFLLGHLHDITIAGQGENIKLATMRTFGQLTTKFAIAGEATNILIVDKMIGPSGLPISKLRTQSLGFDIARSEEDLFETLHIDNDLQKVANRIYEVNGETPDSVIPYLQNETTSSNK